MRKSNILSACLFAVLAGVLLWHAFSDRSRSKERVYERFGDWLDQHFFGDRDLEERRVAILRFMQVHDDLRNEYFEGRLTLEETVDRIHAACRDQCPDYLAQIAKLEIGDTPQERIARNIARQVEENNELRTNKELRERLQGELAELLRKRHKQPPMMGAMAA